MPGAARASLNKINDVFPLWRASAARTQQNYPGAAAASSLGIYNSEALRGCSDWPGKQGA